ncbi:hypothetical protein [Flavobacterium luteolum]|uniref:hypothetical protein n=1 Tax=Flavobacterium luteolum TaxID=3003259 RepID=UPI00248DF947|nr:hypothetical protein [Flavobacterium luteolum]
MKKHFASLFFLILFQNVFSQEYHFDYFTLYKFDKDSLIGNNSQFEYNYSNSKDSTYILKITKIKDTISSAVLVDLARGKNFIYKDESHKNKINDISLLSSSISFTYNTDYCKLKKNGYFYEVLYSLKDNVKNINIKQFKNNRKRELINESFYETAPSEISKNQHFNFRILATPLWCQKFRLKNNEVITSSYFIEKGKKMYFRKLLKIEEIDFSLDIKNKNITAN